MLSCACLVFTKPKSALDSGGDRSGKEAASIHGNAQQTTKGRKETTHGSTSERVAKEMSNDSDAVSVHMHQRISTITNGEVPSKKLPDVAKVRTDGKIDIIEVRSPSQSRDSQIKKWQGELGDRAGKIDCIECDKK